MERRGWEAEVRNRTQAPTCRPYVCRRKLLSQTKIMTARAESAIVSRPIRSSESTEDMGHEYLTDLHRDQRLAAKHGITNESAINLIPLLVIAGAGTGKTKTLAHRVAHLVVNGIDPQRILLLTFSRRAALDMTRRVERITAKALGT